MTPAIWNNFASHIEKNEKTLVIIGTGALIIFVIILIGFITGIFKSFFLLISAISIVMFCCGLGMVRYFFKTQIEKKYNGFPEYLKSASLFTKCYLWYASIFMTIWLAGIIFIFFASILISVQNK